MPMYSERRGRNTVHVERKNGDRGVKADRERELEKQSYKETRWLRS